MASGVFPALPLEPAAGGLLSAATVKRYNTALVNWANGPFGWDSFACPGELVLTDLCAGKKSGPISSGAGGNNSGWPFGIVSQQECLSTGYTVEERKKMVANQIEVGTQKALERELQTGEAVNSVAGRTGVHWLADGDATDVSPATVGSVLLGVAALEQALADCGIGAQGVIHMPRAAAALLGDDLVREGNKLFTYLGTPVVAGTGYVANLKPAATTNTAGRGGTVAAPTTPWSVAPSALSADGYIYATGPVAVHLGPVEILDEQIDRANNIITVTAARPAAVYWDSCCHFAAKVKYA